MTLSICTIRRKLAFFCFSALLGMVFIFASLGTVSAEELPMIFTEEVAPEEPLIPVSWQEGMVLPSLNYTLTVVSSVFDEATGNTDVVVRYSLINDGDQQINGIQLSVDLQNQLGATFLGLNGPLTSYTCSGSMLTASGASLYGGNVSGVYDGVGDVTLFDDTPKPAMEAGDCLAIDIPISLGPNPGLTPIQLTGSGSYTYSGAGSPITFSTAAVTLLPGCESESLACAGRVNLTIGAECYGVVTLNSVFLNRDKDPLRYHVILYQNGVAVSDTVTAAQVGMELTYEVQDRCFNNKVSCWGKVVVENKTIPTPTSEKYNYICGETYEDLATIDDLVAAAKENCAPPISNVSEVYNTDGDKCTGYLTTRTVMADLDLGSGGKVRAPLHIDSIMEMPIDTSDILGPKGKLFGDAVMIPCDVATIDKLTPDFIERYYNNLPASTGSGTAYAYPYLNRGIKVTKTETPKDSIRETIVPDSLIYIDGVPYRFDVVVKDTIPYIETTYDTMPHLLRLDKGNICNLSVKCSDQLYESCVGPKTKILRTWTVLDWCSGRLKNYDQWIVLTDEQAPAIKPMAPLQAKLLPWECAAQVALSAEVSDNCSGVVRQQWTSSAGIIVDGVLQDISLSDNPITVTLTASDACGNDSTLMFQVLVVDDVRPVAVAVDQLNANLLYDPAEMKGITKVLAENINAGSHDSDCGTVSTCVLLDTELQNPIFQAPNVQATDKDGNLLYHAMQCHVDGIYYDTTYLTATTYDVAEVPYVICKEYVKFCCEDIGTHKVALVVSDNSPDSEDGISWTNVLVEDKTTSHVQCQSITVQCGDDISVDALGTPQVIFGICAGGTLSHVDVEDIDGCGQGRITRQWFIDNVLKCEQTIIINGALPFDPKAIKWPRHYDDRVVEGIRRECENDTLQHIVADIPMGESFTCGGDALDAPSWCESSCGLLAMSHEDREVDADGGCRKIIRKWTIIDWCNYSANGSNIDDDPSDTFIAYDDEWLGEGDWRADTEVGEACATCEKVKGTLGDIYFRYQNVDVDGYYTYDQVIVINDTTAPKVEVPVVVTVNIFEGATSKEDTYKNCVGDTTITARAVELCGDIVLDAGSVSWLIEVINEEGTVISTKNTKGATATMNSRPGAAGARHFIKWYVSDACGNQGYAETAIRYEDDRAPTPVCIATISTATMDPENGGVQIWASDFDRGSYDNCGPVKVYFKDELGFGVSSLSFGCADIPNGISTMKEIKMYVSDEAGNESYCYVSLRIDDNSDICEDESIAAAMIAGAVITTKGDMLEKAQVTLSAGDQILTDVSGTYEFPNNDLYSSYRLTANKNDDPLNGVSTLDLLLIQRHLLGITPFDTPYKVIAGDINSDGRVSSIDLVQLRRLLLGITIDFPHNQSWRFLRPGQTWKNDLSPFPFEEELIIQELRSDMPDQNFQAVKIGDVSGNAIANSLLAGSRSGGQLELLLADQWVTAGQTVEVPVRVAANSILAAYQMTISTYGAKVNGLVPGQLWLSDANYALLNPNTATVAWHNAEPQQVNDVLMYISITASKDAYVSDLLDINSSVTEAEAYDDNYTPMEIAATFVRKELQSLTQDEYALQQNQPNPFSDMTEIGFTLAEAGAVKLTVSDAAGKILKVIEGNYSQGSHRIQLHRSEVNTSGIAYYQLESGTYTETRKMIIIK